MSPDHEVWFPTDVIDGNSFFSDDFDETSLPESGFADHLPPPEVHKTGSVGDHDDLKYKIDAVTIVTGIDKRINLSHLCDAASDIFGVRSQGMLLLLYTVRFCLTCNRSRRLAS